MPKLIDAKWQKIYIEQRNSNGCISAGIEWILRYLNYQNLNLRIIQENYEKCLYFGDAKKFIEETFSGAKFQHEIFERSVDKISRIAELLEKDIPCLVSLFVGVPFTGRFHKDFFHIMPVLSIEDNILTTLDYARKHEKGFLYNVIKYYTINQIKWWHDNREGGNDIAWIKIKDR